MLFAFSGKSFNFYSLLASVFLSVLVCGAGNCVAEEGGSTGGQNRLLSMSFDTTGKTLAVNLTTESPVGYRYTVYDSSDPLRIVLDFPGMEVAKLPPSTSDAPPPVKEIKVSSMKLPSGSLGRVEFMLEEAVPYKVSLSEKVFTLQFTEKTSVKKAAGSDTVITPAAVASARKELKSASKPSPAVREGDARRIDQVVIQENRVEIQGSGKVGPVKHFTLGAPPRLVVDVLGVKPGFSERVFSIEGSFRQLRVGTYQEKTRFVFDAAAAKVPDYTVVTEGNTIAVSWGERPGTESNPPVHKTGVPVTVESVKFELEDGKSVLKVELSGPAEVIEPSASGDVVHFGIRNANISRALRRTVDASSFPSSVKLITPYTVQDKGVQNVLFAAELKGPVPFSLQKQAGTIHFKVENGPFAEDRSPAAEKVRVPVPAAESPVKMAASASPSKEVASPEATKPKEASMAKVKPAAVAEAAVETNASYSGQKISLVFDDADIRKILQLIGDVSELNIIASDDVKGNITLRLIDVPWDQALDLIMETKGLGMLREGNVVRIMPQEKIRTMRQAELTAVKEERELEPLVTEVVSVSYTDLKNVAAPARELLSPRGKITEDNRNKQLIVTDIPSVLQEVKKLVAILDTPERQVMIEARIVEASSTFSRDLGVKWGISSGEATADPRFNVGLGGSFLIAPPAPGSVLGGSGLATGITFGRVGVDSTVLDLRISALESTGNARIISTPRVSTLNGGEATISQGTKIPYQSSGADGLPKTEFVDANLELKVKPVINPDGSVILTIAATNSSIGSTVSTGAGSAPAIDTKEAKTMVLVQDGETTVIGGIFVESENYSQAGVPWLSRVPILGHLFKSTNVSNNRSELLVFITPRIVN